VLQCVSVWCSLLLQSVALLQQIESTFAPKICVMECVGVRCRADRCSKLTAHSRSWSCVREPAISDGGHKFPVLQCGCSVVAVCCSVLQSVAVCCSVLQRVAVSVIMSACALHCVQVTECCSVVAVCCSMLQCGVCCSMLQFVATQVTYTCIMPHLSSHPVTPMNAPHIKGSCHTHDICHLTSTQSAYEPHRDLPRPPPPPL